MQKDHELPVVQFGQLPIVATKDASGLDATEPASRQDLIATFPRSLVGMGRRDSHFSELPSKTLYKCTRNVARYAEFAEPRDCSRRYF